MVKKMKFRILTCWFTALKVELHKQEKGLFATLGINIRRMSTFAAFHSVLNNGTSLSIYEELMITA